MTNYGPFAFLLGGIFGISVFVFLPTQPTLDKGKICQAEMNILLLKRMEDLDKKVSDLSSQRTHTEMLKEETRNQQNEFLLKHGIKPPTAEEVLREYKKILDEMDKRLKK